MVYTFTVVDGKLMAWGAVLRRLGPNQFSDLVGNPITFKDKDGVMTARLDLDGQAYFDGSRVPEVHMTQAALEGFAGRYRSDELDATYTLTIEQCSLTLKNRSRAPVKLIPISSNEFQAGDMGTIVISTGANARVSGLTLFSQAARGITFKKTD